MTNGNETRRLDLEERRVRVEEAREKRERNFFWVTPVSVLVPLVVLAFTLWYNAAQFKEAAEESQKLQAQKAADDFDLKVVEILMNQDSPDVTYAKAQALKELWGDKVKANLSAFQPASFRGSTGSKKELIHLLAEHPGQRAKLVAVWKALFPGDAWVDEIPMRPPPVPEG